MLHARAGYRCARPTPSISSDSACNARPVHTGPYSWVSRVDLAGPLRLPVYPGERTFSG
jgi:hypothetical protein